MTKSQMENSISENRKIWLKQLRDPNAKKAIGALESSSCPDLRCCLGHACYALGIERKESSTRVFYGGKNEWKYTSLPRPVSEMLGIDDFGLFKEPVLYKLKEYKSLADLNDKSDITPQKIADIIEANLEADNIKSYP